MAFSKVIKMKSTGKYYLAVVFVESMKIDELTEQFVEVPTVSNPDNSCSEIIGRQLFEL
ncbi:MAG: hypothetical protein V8Q70_00660 [Bacteroides eggerthii]|jgi:hypothetical protein